MNFEKALKTTGVRLTFDSTRWLVWDDFMGWNVYERRSYAKITTLLTSVSNLEEALDVLIKED